MRYNVEEIKSKISYPFFYVLHAGNLHPTGNGWHKVQNFCPFHNDKKPGTLHVNVKTGAFHCFACGESGDVVKFLMKKYNLKFLEALKMLKKEAGV